MKILQSFFAALLLMLGAFAQPAAAGERDPLFINMTTDDPDRANMAITFGANQMARGHPLTIFLNDRGVFVGSRVYAGRFGEH